MSKDVAWHRRHFVSAGAATIAATQFGMIGFAVAQEKASAIKPGTNTSFAPLKQIDAGALNVG